MLTHPYNSLWSVFALLLALAITHATFQLGVSVLTLLSGHSLGRKRSLRRLFMLNLAYVTGSFVMTMLLLGALLTVAFTYMYEIEPHAWMIFVVVSCIIAAGIMTRYYRRGKGTVLWLPRSAANYLADRARRTKNVFEAGILGGAAVLAELPFTIVPLMCAAYLMMVFIAPVNHLAIMSTYSLIVVSPLILITVLIAGGHRLSTIQRWREENKSFLQYAAATLLLAIALYVAIFYVSGGSV